MADEMPMVEGVEHRFVDANGIRVHVAEAGAADAPTVLLLHGWPQHWYLWRRVMTALSGEYRLLAPDLRGFGWTEAPGRGYDGETFAADQVALLDALGLERAHVVGHDWGGWTAFLLGILRPDRIDRMVVCNAPHPWPRLSPRIAMEAWRSWYTWVIATPGLGRWVLRQQWIARRYLGGDNVGTPFTDEEMEMYSRSFQEPARAQAIVELYRYYQRALGEGIRGQMAATSARLADAAPLRRARHLPLPQAAAGTRALHGRHARRARIRLRPLRGRREARPRDRPHPGMARGRLDRG